MRGNGSGAVNSGCQMLPLLLLLSSCHCCAAGCCMPLPPHLRHRSGLPPQRAVLLCAAVGLVQAAALLTEAQIPPLLASHVSVNLLAGGSDGRQAMLERRQVEYALVLHTSPQVPLAVQAGGGCCPSWPVLPLAPVPPLPASS